MNKGGMTVIGKIDSGMGNLKAKPIKTPGSRGITRKQALPKRSMGFSYKK